MTSRKGCLTPFQRKLLNRAARSNLTRQQGRRIEIMLLTDQGLSQSQICKKVGCSPATARTWMMMAEAGQAHRWRSNPIGRPCSANEEYRRRLKRLVHQSPRKFGYSFRRWTGRWLGQHLEKEVGIRVSPRHVNRLLRQMGLSTSVYVGQRQPLAASSRITIGDIGGSRRQEG